MPLPVMLVALIALQTPGQTTTGPDATAVRDAMNDGVELHYPQFQELTDVKVLRGGGTMDGQWLFVCEAKLTWKMSSTDAFKILEAAIDQDLKKSSAVTKSIPGFGGGLINEISGTAIASLKSQLGEFKKGDTVTPVRFRVRLERAGTDWVVMDAKLLELESNTLRDVKTK